MTAPDGAAITLHLGAHRTSSTRTQRLLRDAQAKGRLTGTWFAGPDDVRTLAGIGAFAVDRAPATWRLGSPAWLHIGQRDLARRIADGDRRIVISDETLLGDIDAAVLGGRGLYPEAPARMRGLRRTFGRRPVRPVLAVRNYADWFASAYATVVRRRPMPEPSGLAAAWARLPRGWPDVVADVVAAFGRCDVVRFEDIAWDKDVLLRALAPDEMPNLPRNRVRFFPSMSGAAVEELGRWRADGRTFVDDDLNRLIHRLRGRPPLAPFDDAAKASLEARYAADIASIPGLGARMLEPQNLQIGRGRAVRRAGAR